MTQSSWKVAVGQDAHVAEGQTQVTSAACWDLGQVVVGRRGAGASLHPPTPMQRAGASARSL